MDGDLIWKESTPSNSGSVSAICQTSDGNIIAGTTWSTYGDILKYNLDGDLIWKESTPTNSGSVSAIGQIAHL